MCKKETWNETVVLQASLCKNDVKFAQEKRVQLPPLIESVQSSNVIVSQLMTYPGRVTFFFFA
jgi:hypothetical protein